MSDKTINYIGMGLGILVTIVIVTLGRCWDCSYGGVFTISLQHTVFYDWFKPVIGSSVGVGILRLFIFFICLWLSYKFREKIGKTVVGSIGNFHKKV